MAHSPRDAMGVFSAWFAIALGDLSGVRHPCRSCQPERNYLDYRLGSDLPVGRVCSISWEEVSVLTGRCPDFFVRYRRCLRFRHVRSSVREPAKLRFPDEVADAHLGSLTGRSCRCGSHGHRGRHGGGELRCWLGAAQTAKEIGRGPSGEETETDAVNGEKPGVRNRFPSEPSAKPS